MKIRMIKLVVTAVLAFGAAAPTLAGDEAAGPSASVFVPSPLSIAPSSSVFVPPIAVPVGVPGGAEPATAPAAAAAATALSSPNTNEVVSILNAGQAFCVSMRGGSYTIDCLAERMTAAATAMPKTGEYADARAALLQGASRLNALAVANADPSLPRATARQPKEGGMRSTRPLVPVRKERMSQVAAQALQIVAETETLLLRSGEASKARKVHYARIAEAVESNKVLLRSI